MLSGLLAAVFFMGLAGVPHCAAMCAAPCALAMPQGVGWRALLARSFGYAALGAVAAGATSWLGRWSAVAALVQPLWLMALLASVLMGGWLLWRGEMPWVVQEQGRRAYQWLRWRLGGPQADRWGWMLGALWAVLPCGLLYGAVGVAALAPSAVQGGLLMAVFSLPGAFVIAWAPRGLGRLGLSPASVAPADGSVAPILWVRQAQGASLAQPVEAPKRQERAESGVPSGSGIWRKWLGAADARLALRLAGLCLMLGCGWALWHRLWAQWQVWCA